MSALMAFALGWMSVWWLSAPSYIPYITVVIGLIAGSVCFDLLPTPVVQYFRRNGKDDEAVQRVHDLSPADYAKTLQTWIRMSTPTDGMRIRAWAEAERSQRKSLPSDPRLYRH